MCNRWFDFSRFGTQRGPISALFFDTSRLYYITLLLIMFECLRFKY